MESILKLLCNCSLAKTAYMCSTSALGQLWLVRCLASEFLLKWAYRQEMAWLVQRNRKLCIQIKTKVRGGMLVRDIGTWMEQEYLVEGEVALGWLGSRMMKKILN